MLARIAMMQALHGRINDFDVEVLGEFIKAYAQTAGATVHMDCVRGDNLHHIAEAAFKALGLASRQAFEIAGTVAFDPMAQHEVLGARGHANRVGLHKAHPVQGAFQRGGREKATGDGKPPQVVEGDQHSQVVAQRSQRHNVFKTLTSVQP